MSFEFAGYLQRSERFQQELESPMEDVLGATAEQAITELPIASILRMNELSRAQASKQRIDAETARQRVKDSGLEGRLTVSDDGIAEQALDILISRKKEEVRRQDILSRAPTGFGSKAQQLGMAFAASALDPVNVGLSFVPAVGQARYLRYLAGAKGILGRTAIRAGVGAVEGAAGAAIIEPLVYAAKTQEQADYDMTDSLLNVAFGTVFGGGLHVLGGLAADAGKALSPARVAKPRIEPTIDGMASRVDAMPLPEREIAMRTAVAQAMQGKAVDVVPVVRQSEASNTSAGGDMRQNIDEVVEVDPNTLIFRESDQGRIEQARELFPEGEGYSTIVSILENNGERTILDGHNRSALAMERGDTIRTAQLRREEYDDLSAKGFDDMEISYAALTDAAEYDAASDLNRQFPGAGIAARGDAAFDRLRELRESQKEKLGPFDSGAREAINAAERQATPESEVTADVPAAQAADRQIAETPAAKDPIAEQEALMADELAQLKEAARVADIDLGDDLAEFDEALKLADEYGKAARAAVICGMAH